MGLFGPPDVEKMKAKNDVNGLFKALTYGDPKEDYWTRRIIKHKQICQP